MEHLRALEIALHQHDVRKNIDKLKKLLHQDFIEIGYSGKTYDLQSSLDNLLSETPPDYSVWSQDYEFSEYAPDIIQVIYRSAHLNNGGNLTRHAKRTSFWVNESGNWQMKFHQATPVAVFEKSSA